jgi:glycosyltransferase involved in cell wall biosynthesis
VKIAHVTATFPPYLGGTGNVALQNARSLARLGHEVTVYTAAASGASTIEGGEVNVRRLRTLARVGNAPLTPHLLLVDGYDIVHLHYPFIFGAEMILVLSRLRSWPYVLTYHNDLISPGLKGKLFSAYERMWAGPLMRSAAKLIVTSWGGAHSSQVLGPLIQSAPSRFREIPNGVDMGLFSPAARDVQFLDRLEVGKERLVILFVGSMDSAHHPKGGVPILLEAVARLGDSNIVTLFVGGGDKVGTYAARAAELGLQDHVRFLGPVPNEALPSIYAAADVVVQPSVLFEPFGLVAVEAMACGRPVIVSDLPGVRSVVSDAGGGLLAAPGDANDLAAKIQSLLANPDLRARLGVAGRAGVRDRYDLEAVGPRLEATYMEVLSRG